MRVLLFQIYGNNQVYQLELTYSVLSAYEFIRSNNSDIHMVLICDPPNQRQDLPVENIVISPEQLLNWQLGGRYNHGMQVYAFEHVLKHFNAPVVMVDTDTIFINHPEILFERVSKGRSLLNAKEMPLKNLPEWPEWERIIAKSGGEISRIPISKDTIMYNIGVLGLDPSDISIINDVESIMKTILDESSVFTANQLAYSMVLAKQTQVSVCEDVVQHYWSENRAYYRYQFARMFASVASGSYLESYDMELPRLEKRPPTSIKNRIIAKLKRLTACRSDEYRSAFLAYLSALSCHRNDPDLANVWAEQSLNMLVWGLKTPVTNAHMDFTLFNKNELKKHKWMNSSVRNRWHEYWGDNEELH